MSYISSPTQKGQGLVEYALIMVLIAVAVIAALTLIGPRVSAMYSQVNSIIPGSISDSELPPPPTEEPFGFASKAEAESAFCISYTGTDHFHVHFNTTTSRYIGLANHTPSPTGFTLLPPSYCP